ncbi:DUF424 domain-containing protein [Haloplanus rubicundus]|uniref:DUF424 domain-containing protein n=1 Tax=Haloplanus rubicundus TaxID=1547898 RepID=A0A345E8N0_9EURY|nr:DUF424 domain-containing protein [Haloplanus rubicundus]AXG05226.1 DUF424 domain-containing protein [Haloplanus rubicundus]AXG08552.1 DUF424 domain-containing protein [Haloplanus rubicundus]
MLVRERDTPEGLLVAVCDEECLGETYGNGDVSLTVTEEFYGGDEADADEVVDSLTRASVANLVGEQCVTVAIEAGLVDEERVLDLGDALHAQLLWL